MLKYLRDPIWQFIGVAVGIVTLFAMIALAYPTLVERWWLPVLIGASALIALAAVLCFRGARQASADRLWDGWREDLRRIEKKARLLTAGLSGYTSVERYGPTPQQLYGELENDKGLLLRHKDLYAAANDFLNRAGIVMADWHAWDSRRERDEAVADMLEHYNRLLEQIDKVGKANPDRRAGV